MRLLLLLLLVFLSPRRSFETIDFADLRDEDRKRPVPIKVYLPEGDGAHPLLIYSHGGAGNRDAHQHEAEFMAERGYVVFCLEHVYSNTDKTKEHMREAKGTIKQRMHAALQRITRDPKAVLERPKDVRFAIDMAEKWNREHRKIKGRIRLKRIAVLGHSFGAYTTMAVCGARPILDHLDMGKKGLAEDLSDDRVTIGVAMSPQGPGTSRYSEESYRTLDRPMLCFSGTKDDQLGHDGSTQPAKRRLEGFQLFPKGDKYMVWLDGADHLSFADNPKSHLFPSPARKDTMKVVKTMTAVFCDAYLKDDKGAKKKLSKTYVTSLTGRVVRSIEWHHR